MLASSLQLKTGDTPIIFDWLMGILSYQGISDAVAYGFMARHGNITWAQIEGALSADRDCRKLARVLGVYRLSVSEGLADVCRARPF